MNYENIVEGTFLQRPNRFIAHVQIDSKIEICHVKNTGRCKELLIPGTTVYLEYSNNPNRKTSYSLVAVKKENRLINIDSQAPNKIFGEALSNGIISLPEFHHFSIIKPEKVYGDSRFDFYLESCNQKGFVEVKGVTLEENGVVKFPDAPTKRGLKHIHELIRAKEAGYIAYIVFVIQMDHVTCFKPNDEMQLEFGKALRIAKKKGVHILAYESNVSPCNIVLNGQQCKVFL